MIYSTTPHIARFELDNFHNIRSLIHENHIDCEWQDVDSCHSYTSSTLFEAEVATVKVLRSLDPQLGNMVTVVFPDSVNPSFADLRLGGDVVGAIVQKSSASLWPYKLVSWILERLISANGAGTSMNKISNGSFNLQTSTPVIHLQPSDGGGWIVHTSQGMLHAKQVILATNAYTSYLLSEFTTLIQPVRGEMSALIPPAKFSPTGGEPLAGHNSYGFWGRGTGSGSYFNQDDYLVQRPFFDDQAGTSGGELMFGGGRQYAKDFGVGVSDDSAVDQPAADYLRQALNRVLDIQGNGDELKASHEWSGIMGFSRDGHPWVGEVPKELGGGGGLWMCAGFTGHGMPNASLCAKAVVDMTMGRSIDEVHLPLEFQLSTERVQSANKVDPPPPGSIFIHNAQ
jgi:hypothetical protein